MSDMSSNDKDSAPVDDPIKSITSSTALQTAIRKLATTKPGEFQNISSDEAKLIYIILTEILKMAREGEARIIFKRLDTIIDREMKNI